MESELSSSSPMNKKGDEYVAVKKQIEQVTRKAASKSKERKPPIEHEDEPSSQNSELEQAKIHNVKYQKQMEKKGRNAPDKPKPQAAQIDLSQQQQTIKNNDKGGAAQMNKTMKDREKLF